MSSEWVSEPDSEQMSAAERVSAAEYASAAKYASEVSSVELAYVWVVPVNEQTVDKWTSTDDGILDGSGP